MVRSQRSSELQAFVMGMATASAVCYLAFKKGFVGSPASVDHHHGQAGGQFKDGGTEDSRPFLPGTVGEGVATKARPLPPALREEQLSRNTLFFGEKGMSSIRQSTVVVVGLGGVGSHCAHMLARSGVERLVLIDFDQVTLSSTNRHATATLRG